MTGMNGTQQLQRMADANRHDNERGAEVYARYQQNTAKAAALKADILRGTGEGENICTLLLKAVETISILTDDAVFQKTVEGNITGIYADVLHSGEALEAQIERTRNGLKLLKKAAESAVTPEEKRRLAHGIEAHEARIARLTARRIDEGRGA